MRTVLIVIIPILILFSCSNQTEKSLVNQEIESLNPVEVSQTITTNVELDTNDSVTIELSSVWVSNRTETSPNCNDTLFLDTEIGSSWYSCEQEYTDSITYSFKEDTLDIDLWFLKDEFSGSAEQEVKMKFSYIQKDDELNLVYVNRKVDQQFVNVPIKGYQQKFEKAQ